MDGSTAVRPTRAWHVDVRAEGVADATSTTPALREIDVIDVID
jgi:hypothetical protein